MIVPCPNVVVGFSTNHFPRHLLILYSPKTFRQTTIFKLLKEKLKIWISTRRELLNHIGHSQKEIRSFSFQWEKNNSRQRSFVRESCLDLILDWRICFNLPPPLTLNIETFLLNIETLFFNIFSSQLIHFSLLVSHFNICIPQKWTGFLAVAEVKVATHRYKHCFTVIVVAINMETINYFLLYGCVKTLNFTSLNSW